MASVAVNNGVGTPIFFAKSIGCPTPLFTATEGIYDTALNSGYAMQDTAAVCAVMEKMANFKRRKAARA